MQKIINLRTICVVVLLVGVSVGVVWAADNDPAMIASFVDLTTKNKLTSGFANTPFELQLADQSYLCIKQRLQRAGSRHRAEDYLASFSYDSDGDLVAQKYVETAKARGNIVRVYKPAINKIICRKFYNPMTPTPNSRQWFGKDRALIEFDKSDKIISFMSRIVHLIDNVCGTSVMHYTSIYLGPQNARQLENILNNRVLEENFLREL